MENIIKAAVERGASDLHIKAGDVFRARIDGELKPLTKQRLTPEQRERVTELLFRVAEIESQIEDLKGSQGGMLESGRPQHPAFVLVAKVIHEGVTISIGSRQTTFDRSVKGPARIEERKVRGATELVCMNQLTGSSTILPSMQIRETE